jgi:hypothetical protein
MMRIKKNNCKPLAFTAASLLMGAGLLSGNIANAQEAKSVANPDKYMIRLGAYYVDRASTDFLVLDSSGVGVGISFDRDLGGDTTDSVARIDGYYRFNDRHRLEFGSFGVDRHGETFATLTIGDTVFLNETITTDIKYTITKVGYAYSFYHSPQVELSLAAGLNITDYDISYSGSSGTSDAVGVTAPLPLFGLQMTYAMSPKWSVHFLSEAFYIDIEDTLKGTLLNSEFSIEYKAFKNFAIGAGTTRVSTDLDVNDDDWKGSFTDSHRGYLVYGALYF